MRHDPLEINQFSFWPPPKQTEILAEIPEFNIQLFLAIVARNIADIKRELSPEEKSKDDSYIPNVTYQYLEYMVKEHKDLLNKPIEFALQLSATGDIEATTNDEPTRYDVIVLLAENFNQLCDLLDKEPKEYLEEILNFTTKDEGEYGPSTDLFISFLGETQREQARAIQDKLVDEKIEIEQVDVQQPLLRLGQSAR